MPGNANGLLRNAHDGFDGASGAASRGRCADPVRAGCTAVTWLILIAKLLHIAALLIWCAGLVLLPLTLSFHPGGPDQHRFNRVRLLTHVAYTQIVTPAAVIAVGTGILLIFLREVFDHWFAAKLLMVSMLAACHAWIGHQVAKIAEHREAYDAPYGTPLAIGNLAVMVAILATVLLKPAIPESVMPDWLTSPYGAGLWFDDPS